MKQENDIFNFPVTIDTVNGTIGFIETTSSELKSLPFHDGRLSANKQINKTVKFSEITELSDNHPVSYVFHTAFCGSTLLSRLLGDSDKFISVREPSVLMEMANVVRMKKVPDSKVSQSLQKIISSFSNESSGGKKLIIKPTNASNNLIKNLLLSKQNSKAILLYTELDDFLISILKKGEAGKSFIRNLYNVLSLDKSPFAMTDFRKVNTMTDLQIACLVWSMQMYEYQMIERSITKQFNSRIKFLNANDFLDDPKSKIVEIAMFFGEKFTDKDIINLEEQGVLSSHAKLKNTNYSSNIRLEEKQKIKEKYHQEFFEIKSWVSQSLELPHIPEQDLHLKFSAAKTD